METQAQAGVANGVVKNGAAHVAPVAEAWGVEPDQSPTLGKLAAALAKAQRAIKGAAKDKVNPHFKSKYADLASIWDACREPLAANELAVMQRVSSGKGTVIITTQLVHSSGEWVKDRLEVPVAQATAQGQGSAITYGRRYSLAALVGVAADEDDDGNAASGHKPTQAAPQPKPKGETPYQRLQRTMQERGIDPTQWGPALKHAMAPKTKTSEVTEEHVAAVLIQFAGPPEDKDAF
jgi:hypothetical protein